MWFIATLFNNYNKVMVELLLSKFTFVFSFYYIFYPALLSSTHGCPLNTSKKYNLRAKLHIQAIHITEPLTKTDRL